VPEGAVGLVLLVDDPDAPMAGSFVHWVLYDVDPARRGLTAGELPAEACAGVNGYGATGYLGPAPPAGDPAHHYVFRLLAVDQPLRFGDAPTYQDVEAAAGSHLLAQARLIGTYQR
jgi:Raf kinase inhibitor-like YbhB/YbcL family protein